MENSTQKKLIFIQTKVVITLFCLISSSIFSQTKDTLTLQNRIKYSDRLLVRFNMSTQTDAYTLKKAGDDDFKIAANNSYKLFITGNYKFLGFSYGLAPSFFGGNSDNDLKGKSSFKDLKFDFFLGNHWLQTIQYKKIRGYYVENTISYLPDRQEGDPYFKLSNLKTLSYAMATAYVFNKDFSLKSITSFTEWQQKSTGTFIPIFRYEYDVNSTEIFGEKIHEDSFNFRLGFGYFHNFIVAKNIYIAPNLTPSIGIRLAKNVNTHTDNSKTIDNETSYPKFLEGGLKAGYNSDRIIFGGGYNFNVNWTNSDVQSLTINNQGYLHFYFGYRFGPPQFLSKTVKTIEEKVKS